MFCHNCGNKLEENMIVCPNCGYLVGRNQYKKNIKTKSSNANGIISLVFGIISLLMCFNFMLSDISNVGMYTRLTEKIYYALDLVLAPLFMAFITLIISCVGKNRDKTLNNCALFLSIISFFFVITEIVIVVIY